MSEPIPIAAAVMTDGTIDADINDAPTGTQVDNAPQDPASARKKLERSLSLRPDKKELVDRNILKAPALQAAQAELQRSQLEDKLDQALQQRPNVEELVKEGILKPDEAPLSA